MLEGAPHRGRTAPRGRLARIGGWLAARFGAVELLAALAFALAAQAGGAALAGAGPLPLGWRGAAGAAAGVLLALYLRVADDLKDWETDRRLAAAGDARFRERPQVTGEVAEADLRLLKLGVAAAIGLLLAPQPRGALLLGGLSFVGAWLSSRWFFLPSMAQNLPVAFVTHNPLALLFLGFGAAVGAGMVGAAPAPLPAASLLLGLYLPIAAWEIARKVRTPEEETGYQTWSAVLGWRAAAVIPALLAAASSALLARAGAAAGLGPAYPLVLGAAALVPAAAAVTFLVRPSPRGGRRLRPAVELYALAAGVGLLAFAILERGIVAR